jgi:retinol dehydrogenase-12
VVEEWELDLASYASVKANAAKLYGLERLDVLVENARILTYQFKLFGENESIITTNVVSLLLHALLMLPKLRENAKGLKTTPKLVFTSSFVHAMAKFSEQKESHIFEALAD